MRTRQLTQEELAALQAHFPTLEITDTERPLLYIPAEDFLHLLSYLKKGDLQMQRLENLTAVDYKDSFEMVYHLFSPEKLCWVTVKVKLDREAAELPSVTPIFPGANYEEREVYDLMGIRFTGHPDLRRIFLTEDFPGHPLRKDFVNPPPPDVPRIRRES